MQAIRQMTQSEPVYQNQGFHENIYVNQGYEHDEVDEGISDPDVLHS